jgi:acetolactate synthase-1/2/3 large subunit
MKKYSDLLVDWLVELGYTHCFYVAGGNIMHLLESVRHKFTCIPVVHEVAGGIAAEYFTEIQLGGKAFALVTAGPGLTNILTAIGAAWMESRELLVLGGTVKTTDLSRGKVRQRGFQEIDGVTLTKSITERSVLLDSVVDRGTFCEMTRFGVHGRGGPVFIEIPLDIQGAKADEAALATPIQPFTRQFPVAHEADLEAMRTKLTQAKRPVLLIGPGVSRDAAKEFLPQISALGVPIMVTWNGIDRVPSDHPLYFGRPNTWGQRCANALVQQADLLIALGVRLSIQQTGFNWQQFVPIGEIVQIDCDQAELEKGHPKIDLPICADANVAIAELCKATPPECSEWVAFCREVKSMLPLVENVNNTGPGYLSPYVFIDEISKLATGDDIFIPCSSGSAFTVTYQTFSQKAGQRIISDKGLASMGYGLSGAMGAAVAGKGRRTILVEGDGGFAQNLQELGTLSMNRLNLKVFIFDDNGYASIRMTQKSYFGGTYVGCDTSTGLGMPKWELLFAAYGVPMQRIGPGFQDDPAFLEAFNAEGPAVFLVRVDPEQTYFPKISSRITATGGMESNPLHLLTPDLDKEVAKFVFRYLPPELSQDAEIISPPRPS